MRSDLEPDKRTKRQFYPNMASADWSEFQVWSYKLGGVKSKPTGRPTETSTQETESVGDENSAFFSLANGIVSCHKCVVNQMHQLNIHLPHPDHHGTVYTAYAQFTAGALGKFITHRFDMCGSRAVKSTLSKTIKKH